MKRANIGAERPVEGWHNFDLVLPPEQHGQNRPIIHWDIRRPLVQSVYDDGLFDYAVCSFMLQELTFHELPGALENIRAILTPGGTLRIMVPNVANAVAALICENEDWFPQDERSGGLHGKFCSYVTWFGTVRSVFTRDYLLEVCYAGGFEYARTEPFGASGSNYLEITSLDSRPKEALIVEAVK